MFHNNQDRIKKDYSFERHQIQITINNSKICRSLSGIENVLKVHKIFPIWQNAFLITECFHRSLEELQCMTIGDEAWNE